VILLTVENNEYNIRMSIAGSLASMQQQSATRMWANAQSDGCPAEYRWRPLFNAAKFG